MPNLQQALKLEIARVARRVTKQVAGPLKTASASHRRTIAKLRRELDDLRRVVARIGRAVTREAPQDAAGGEPSRRFSAKGVRAHRKRLQLSAEDFGKLAGVTGQSVYLWERGQRPREAQLQVLAEIRGLGRREAIQRLEALAATAVKRASRRRKRRSR